MRQQDHFLRPTSPEHLWIKPGTSSVLPYPSVIPTSHGWWVSQETVLSDSRVQSPDRKDKSSPAGIWESHSASWGKWKVVLMWVMTTWPMATWGDTAKNSYYSRMVDKLVSLIILTVVGSYMPPETPLYSPQLRYITQGPDIILRIAPVPVMCHSAYCFR